MRLDGLFEIGEFGGEDAFLFPHALLLECLVVERERERERGRVQERDVGNECSEETNSQCLQSV